MRDTAALAGQSDLSRNRQARRLWEPPKRKPRGATPGTSESNINSSALNITATEAAQRACAKAQIRAAQIDTRARLYRALGLIDAALRIEAVASAIREAVLT